jgi:hypothetical protein
MMTCGKSLEIEFTEFLADPRAAAFAAFRAHYPRCAECAAEVRAWTELHGRLSAAHPDPEQLARYENLAPEERAPLDRHLAGCSSCREELAGLAAFDPQRLAAATAPALPAGRKSGPGLGEALAWIGRLLWHPAFAYAMAGLLLFPLIYRSVDTSLEVPGGSLLLGEEIKSAVRPVAPRPSAKRRAPGRRADARFARSAPVAPVEEDREVPEPAEPRLEAFAQREAELPETAAEPLRALGSTKGAAAPKMAAAESPLAARAANGASQVALLPAADLARPAELRFEESAGALRLDAQRRVEIDLPVDRGLELRIPIPAGTPAGWEVEVRVASARGRRELRERVAVPAALSARGGVREVSVRIPSGWLDAGAYRIELQLPAGAPGAERPIRFSLVVNAPRR